MDVVDCADDVVRRDEDALDTDRGAAEEEEAGVKQFSLGLCVGPSKEKGEVELAATNATSGSMGPSAPAPARLFLACPSPSS